RKRSTSRAGMNARTCAGGHDNNLGAKVILTRSVSAFQSGAPQSFLRAAGSLCLFNFLASLLIRRVRSARFLQLGERRTVIALYAIVFCPVEVRGDLHIFPCWLRRRDIRRRIGVLYRRL